MDIKTFYFNALRVACYVAWDATGECVVIDPGCESEREFSRLVSFIEENKLKPVKILLTHGHFDHVMGLQDAAAFWNLDVYVSPKDIDLIDDAQKYCSFFGLEIKPFTRSYRGIADGDKIQFGETTLEVLATPGHTQGGVCFYNKEDGVLFSGDTLFTGSIGRTDQKGGDYDQLMESIQQKLVPLDGDTKVLPGHGTATTIGYERATNPFLYRPC